MKKPFKELTPDLSVGEKLLKEDLDKILRNYYKLTQKEIDAIKKIASNYVN